MYQQLRDMDTCRELNRRNGKDCHGNILQFQTQPINILSCNDRVYTSPNGTTWIRRNYNQHTTPVGGLREAKYYNSIFLKKEGVEVLYSSDEGTTWTAISFNCRDIAWSPTFIIGVVATVFSDPDDKLDS